MRTREMADLLCYWLVESGLTRRPLLSPRPGYLSVSFGAVTTSTRASSMATRVRLVAADLIPEGRVEVVVEPVVRRPRKRDEICAWTISANISNRRPRNGASHLPA